MRFASLGSGSKGNGLVIEVCAERTRTRVLVDCGFGPRELAARLARLGLTPHDLDGIVVTHEHGDHSAGVMKCARRYSLPVFLTHGTLAATPRAGAARVAPTPLLRTIEGDRSFAIAGLEVHPFPVPHDAREPVQFVFSDGCRRLGVLTDTGCSTPHIVALLDRCDALLLECNHDLAMLAEGPYPPPLKQRIASRFGHLDNQTAAAILASIDRSRLQHVIAAHLSAHNNTPLLARSALAAVLGCSEEWVGVANQDDGCAWRDIS